MKAACRWEANKALAIRRFFSSLFFSFSVSQSVFFGIFTQENWGKAERLRERLGDPSARESVSNSQSASQSLHANEMFNCAHEQALVPAR